MSGPAVIHRTPFSQAQSAFWDPPREDTGTEGGRGPRGTEGSQELCVKAVTLSERNGRNQREEQQSADL